MTAAAALLTPFMDAVLRVSTFSLPMAAGPLTLALSCRLRPSDAATDLPDVDTPARLAALVAKLGRRAGRLAEMSCRCSRWCEQAANRALACSGGMQAA